MKDSITNMEIKNSFNLCLMELLTEITHSGVIKVVRIINNIEIPSIPTL